MLPTRRSSLAGGSGPLHVNPQTTPVRAHRTTGSATLHDHGSLTHHSDISGAPYSWNGNSAQEKAVQALISRLSSRLPCHSGITLQALEADEAIQQTVETLLQIARQRLELIMHSLSDLLERITKTAVGDGEGNLALDLLHSQLYVLKVLSASMSYRWQCHREVMEEEAAVDIPSDFQSPASPTPKARTRTTTSTPDDRPEWTGPPRLEDAVAKYALSVMVLFLRQTASVSDRPKTSGHMHSVSFPDFQPPEMASPIPPPLRQQTPVGSPLPSLAGRPSTQSLRMNVQRRAFRVPDPLQQTPFPQSSSPSAHPTDDPKMITAAGDDLPSRILMPPTPLTVSSSSSSINWLISKYSGKIVFHLSASNWNVVFAKIRNKIHHLAQTTEEIPDMVDMKLVACSALDRVKLVQVMQELSSLLVNMKREAQGAVSIALRTALWNWIEYFPKEYLDIFKGTRRLEGAPERVFDMLSSMTESQGKRAFWPTLTVLLAASPERLKQAALAVPKAKKQQINFLETLVKSLGSSTKTSEISMVCLIDLCKAAAYLPPDYDQTPLRALAPELADDLRNRIFSPIPPMKPFYETTEMIDVDLYADALVAIYRFSHAVAIDTVFPACMAPERSDAVKTCVLKACLMAVTEASKIRSQPHISALFPVIAHRTRAIMRAAMQRKYEVSGNMPRRPIAKRYNAESYGDREQLVITIFLLWRADPAFIFYGVMKNDIAFEALISDSIKIFVQPNDKVIRMTAFKANMDIGRYALSLKEGQTYFDESRAHVAIGISVGATAAAVLLLDSRDSFEDDRNALGVLHQLTNSFVQKASTLPAAGMQPSKMFNSACNLVEIALIVTLTSPQIDIPWLAATCLKRLIELEKYGLLELKELSPEELAARQTAFEALGDNNIVVTGRLAMQKRIRRILQNMTFANSINAAVWEEGYRRWLYLIDTLTRASEDSGDGNVQRSLDRKSSPEERQSEWQNVTLFLMSFGGCCLIEDNVLPPLSTIISMDDLPPRFHRGGRNPGTLVKQFIGQSLELLGLPGPENVFARETIKDAIGLELHPLLFPAFFTHMENMLAKPFEHSVPAWKETFAVFTEQCISVLKLLFDRIQSINETAHINADIGRMVQYLARYIHRSPFSMLALRVKMKYCSLLDSLLSKRELLPLKKELSLRNILLNIVSEWAFDPAAGEALLADRETLQRMQAELDTTCLRTVVKLCERLQLQPVDGTSRSESIHVQSRLFYRYFNLFLKALQRWKEGEGNDTDSVASGHVQRVKASPKDQHALRELVISGLTNLLSANMEAGLKHCLPMGYNEDARIRRIFVHAFARVLQQGTSFVAVQALDDLDRYSRLCEMVRAPDMLLALAICETCPQNDVEDMINVILNIFDTRGTLVALLKTLIDREVTQTSDEAGLFRRNSMSLRMLSAFARLHGYNYIRALLLPLVNQMSAMPPGHSYEMDPSRVREGESLEENEASLTLICQAFLDVICESVAIIPPIFREVCHHIATTVTAMYPEAKYAAVGGFMFLRFICPAIISPSSVDIELPPDNPSMQRGLVLITKIIQNLANNILFGKEAFMTNMNGFLSKNIMPVTRFLSEILKYSSPQGEADQLEWLGMAYDETDHLLLHRFFRVHADKIGKELLSYTGTPSRDLEHSSVGGKQTWDVLCATLVEIGDPQEIPSPNGSSGQNPRFKEFLLKNGHRNTDGVRDIFLVSMDPHDHPVFILSLHKLNVETVDLELLTCHIFKTMLAVDGDGPYDIIIDCTSFSPSSEIPVQWFKFFLELVPEDLAQRWATAYILNPNAYAQKFFRKLYYLYNGHSLAKHVIAASSVAELLPSLHSTVVNAMPFPLGMEREPNEKFAEVKKLDRHRMSLPVTMQVGLTHLRITSIKPKLIWGGLNSKLTEIIMLSDVDDVYNVSTGQEANEFVIRRNRSGGTMYFSSPARDAIVKAVRTAKGKLKADGMASLVERPVQLGNLSATLLNVGLLNVTTEDESLRGAAHDLLFAVCKHMECDDALMLPTEGAFIPSNPAAFAVPFSERMAKFAPHLTLDFLSEFFVGFDKSPTYHKAICLQYLNPWISNLSGFQNPAVSYYEHTGVKLRDSVRSMIDMTLNTPDMYPALHRLLWTEFNKLDNRVINITLDELFRAAIDGGISSRRCESVAETLVVMSSINVRGRVLAKLRRVLAKTLTRPTKTLVENAAWNEVAAMTRLALLVMYNNRAPVQTQLFVPEILHLVTMIVSTGPLIMRTAVHGIVTSLVQSLCVIRVDDEAGRERLKMLLKECFKPDVLKLFGLAREDASSEYTIFDTATEQLSVDSLEKITFFLLDIAEAGAQTTGLANVWRARWVGLVTSTAFQLSAYIQSRAFVVLGTLASSDVDDDLLYQILVAFRTALATSSENDTSAVVSMLRCIRQVVPGLPENSRYLAQILWLAVALIQSSFVSLFSESARLLQVTLETLQVQGAFEGMDVPGALMAARVPLDDISSQLDSVLGLSFECSFSFSLATAIFKGMRHPPTHDAACDVLHALLRTTAHITAPKDTITPPATTVTIISPVAETKPVEPDSLGFFLALLPLAKNNTGYKKLLEEAGTGMGWLGDAGAMPSSISVGLDDGDESVPRIPFEMLGVRDSTDALLVVSFLVAMVNSAHEEREQELLWFLLATAAEAYPEMIALAYEGMMEKINETLASSKNPSILEACGIVFRVAISEQTKDAPGIILPPSASIPSLDHTLVDEGSVRGGTNNLVALQGLGMLGLANNHQFLPAGRSITLIKWINELVSRIIE
ncbi:Ras GTPase activating protein ira2 [Tulasnella sp. JGI-2019a]|nr:Ras GTPase activating protein ira2 [Tulasnella sp. JGI-2019a]